jgi:hypothetical protein
MSSGGRNAILARIRGTTENVALNSADFVIEAAAENYDLKAKILKQVDSLVRPEAIIASNSSSVSITSRRYMSACSVDLPLPRARRGPVKTNFFRSTLWRGEILPAASGFFARRLFGGIMLDDSKMSAQMDLTPQQQMVRLLRGFIAAHAIYTAAKLGVPDQIDDAGSTEHDLAPRLGVDRSGLRRLLRSLTGLGILHGDDNTGRYFLTECASGFLIDSEVRPIRHRQYRCKIL